MIPLGMIISVIAVALAALTLLPAVLIAMGDKVLVSRGKKDPDIEAEGRWASGPASPCAARGWSSHSAV